MTNEEAKNLYNSDEFQETTCHSKLCNYANTGCSDCEITHMNILINEALEKQIPKKPKIEIYKYPYGYTDVRDDECGLVCPCCGGDLVEDDHHCKCGQAIDWKEAE